MKIIQYLSMILSIMHSILYACVQSVKQRMTKVYKISKNLILSVLTIINFGYVAITPVGLL